jgi:hypothetical protein
MNLQKKKLEKEEPPLGILIIEKFNHGRTG